MLEEVLQTLMGWWVGGSVICFGIWQKPAKVVLHRSEDMLVRIQKLGLLRGIKKLAKLQDMQILQ